MVWRCPPLEQKCLWKISEFQFSLESIPVGNQAESSLTKFIPYWRKKINKGIRGMQVIETACFMLKKHTNKDESSINEQYKLS